MLPIFRIILKQNYHGHVGEGTEMYEWVIVS